MRRILFISQYLNRNGTEAFMMNVVRSLHNKSFVFDFLLYGTADQGYSKEVESYGGQLFFIKSRKQSPLSWYWSLFRFFSQHSEDYCAIHFCGNSLTSIAPLFFAWMFRVPIRIVHAHNSNARGIHNRLFHCLKKGIAYKMATHHFACSTMAASWFFGDKDSEIIKNGIDVTSFRFNPDKRTKVRDTLGIGSNDLVLGHVGRFVEEKNHSFLLDVFADVLKAKTSSRLLLIGEGPLMQEIEDKAKRLGISQNILFLGMRKDVNELMQAMDVFVMPSLFEGLPFVLIEAQCSGLPCIISDSINPEICLSKSVDQLPITSVPIWSESIQRVSSIDRSNGYYIVDSSGYNIFRMAEHIKCIYAHD